MERERPEAREDRLTIPAIPISVASIKSGALSVVFHVPYESAAQAWRIHERVGKAVTIEVTDAT